MWFRLGVLGVFAGCSGEDPATDTETPPSEELNEAVCTEAASVECFDELLLDLSFQSFVSDGLVSNTEEDGAWISDVDASAGGFLDAPQNPWVYVKFGADGLEKVEIDDEASLDSMDWDLGLHRFKIRMNGGASGPSCVSAGVVQGVGYDEVDASALETVSLFEDDFFTASCDLVNDSSGFENSPQLALGQWWTYPGCVATSRLPYLVQLADGRLLKLVVQRYYGTNQGACNNNSQPGGDSGQIRIKWQFL